MISPAAAMPARPRSSGHRSPHLWVTVLTAALALPLLVTGAVLIVGAFTSSASTAGLGIVFGGLLALPAVIGLLLTLIGTMLRRRAPRSGLVVSVAGLAVVGLMALLNLALWVPGAL